MAWKTLYTITLNASDLCAGQRNFKPYIPKELKYGIQPGTYRIKYVNGAVRSHNPHRFDRLFPRKIFLYNNVKDQTYSFVKNILLSTAISAQMPSSQYYSIFDFDKVIPINTWNNGKIGLSYENQRDVYLLSSNSIYKQFSYNSQNKRYEHTPDLFLQINTNYTNTWNKYYQFINVISNFTFFDYSLFPQMKFDVFQCKYGTLPGFTSFGSTNRILAQYYAKNENIPDDIYELIQQDVEPLQFVVQEKTQLSFWFTDDCSPCVQGSMNYEIQQLIQDVQINLNQFGLLGFNINSNQVLFPEYYNIVQKTNVINDYQYQYNKLDVKNNNINVAEIYNYNTIGFISNIYDINVTYINKYNSRFYQDIYWKISSYTNKLNVDLITQFNGDTVQFPLLKNTYTILFVNQNTSKYITIDDEIGSNLSGTLSYTFTLNQPSRVKFTNVIGWLYKGSTSFSQIFNYINSKSNYSQGIVKQAIITYNKEIETINSDKIIEQIVDDMNKEFLLVFLDDYVLVVDYSDKLMMDSNSKYIMGPFNSLSQMQNAVKQYCGQTYDYVYDEHFKRFLLSQKE